MDRDFIGTFAFAGEHMGHFAFLSFGSREKERVKGAVIGPVLPNPCGAFAAGHFWFADFLFYRVLRKTHQGFSLD